MNTIRAILAVALLATAPMTAIAGGYAGLDSSNAYTGTSAIMSAGSRAAAISRIRSVPSVGVINLNVRHLSVFRDDSAPDASEFRISAAKNAAGIRRLRAALNANPVTRKALTSRGIAIGRVVGVNVSSSGALRVYIL